MRASVWLAGVACAIATLAGPAPGSSADGALRVQPCTQGRTKAPATCGTLRVLENRAHPGGRAISVRFIVLKAKHPSGRAVYMNPGGPGPTLPLAPFLADGALAKELTVLRDRYDVVLIDGRGFGGSHAIPCVMNVPGKPAEYFRQLWPDARLAACRRLRAETSDLNAYTTNQAVDDLDELRAALGYEKLVLDGYSYGTLFSLIYARTHPERIESLVLDGVAPPGIFRGPVEFAATSQASVSRLFAACRSDGVCHAAFPKFERKFAAIVRRLSRGPMPVRVKNVVTHRIETVLLSREVFSDQLRHALYDPQGASYVPYIIDRAYAGDTLPLGTVIDTNARGFGGQTDWGAFFSYTCAEQMAFITPDEIRRTSGNSWYGDVRVRAQQHACAIWNVRPVARSFIDPVRSTAPALLISGSDDPATPPQYAAQELRYLPNGRAVIVRGAAHGTQTPCTDTLKIQFVRAGSAKGLDTRTCSGAFARPPFATSMKGFPG